MISSNFVRLTNAITCWMSLAVSETKLFGLHGTFFKPHQDFLANYIKTSSQKLGIPTYVPFRWMARARLKKLLGAEFKVHHGFRPVEEKDADHSLKN